MKRRPKRPKPVVAIPDENGVLHFEEGVEYTTHYAWGRGYVIDDVDAFLPEWVDPEVQALGPVMEEMFL